MSFREFVMYKRLPIHLNSCLFCRLYKSCLSLNVGCISLHIFKMYVCTTHIVFTKSFSFPYKVHIFRDMPFVSHCYTVLSCQPIFRHSIYKNSAVYHLGANILCFCMIRHLGSPTTREGAVAQW